jgi:hypothetical protein
MLLKVVGTLQLKKVMTVKRDSGESYKGFILLMYTLSLLSCSMEPKNMVRNLRQTTGIINNVSFIRQSWDF